VTEVETWDNVLGDFIYSASLATRGFVASAKESLLHSALTLKSSKTIKNNSTLFLRIHRNQSIIGAHTQIGFH
jgi:hypothetical protein